MPNASAQPAAAIRARVHDGALRRVTKILFIHARRHFQRAAAERPPGRRQSR